MATQAIAEARRTDQIASVLRILSGNKDELQVVAHSRAGVGRETLTLRAPFNDGLPLSLLEFVAEGCWELRVEPFVWRALNGAAARVHAAFVLWRPQHQYVKRGHRYLHMVTGREVVDSGFAKLPPPTLRVDGQHEIWGAWSLDSPLTDAEASLSTLNELARQTGGVVHAALRDVTLPLAGIVRNWNVESESTIQIIEVDPSRRVALDVLLRRNNGT